MICTADGKVLSNSPAITIQAPVGISVADAEATEGTDAAMVFTVSLSRPAPGTLTVDYLTASGTATSGEDYTFTSGTLTFAAGDRTGTISVPILDDSHNDDGETFTLTLSSPSSGYLEDATATGTIKNRDPLPRALLARFGRTAAVHVVEHVEQRMAARRAPGFEGRVAGRELRRGMGREMALGLLRRLGAAGVAAGPGGGPAGRSRGAFDPGMFSMGFGGQRLLTGSAFSLNRETRRGRHPLVLEPGGAVVVLRPRGGPGAGRRRAHDDARGGLREGADGDGAVAGPQLEPGRLPGGV